MVKIIICKLVQIRFFQSKADTQQHKMDIQQNKTDIVQLICSNDALKKRIEDVSLAQSEHLNRIEDELRGMFIII